MTRPNAARGAAGAPAVPEGPEGSEGPDVRSAVVTGVTTALWYAVPDVVGPRWGRALAKSAVAAAGLGVGLAATAEGRAAREGLRAAGDLVDGAADGPAGEPGRDGERRDESAGGRDDEPGAGTGPDEADDQGAPVDPRLAAAALAVGLGAAAALAVAGEKWTYRLGERWRARGRALPHTRVGLAMGVLAAGLTLLEPRAVGADRGPDA